MSEQFCTVSGDVELCYESFGDPADPALLLTMGLATQMIGWHEDFCQALADRGFHVIRYDNRDVGRSGSMPGRAPTLVQLLRRDKRAASYTFEDMAGDAVGLLDHLDIQRAHVMGASMGGVLAMIAALKHPERVRSLTLVCTAARLQVWRRELFEGWIATAETSGMRAYVTQNLSWMIGQQSWRRLWPLANVVGPLAVRAPVHGLVGQIRGMLDAADLLLARLGEITAPTLVVVGSNDILTPPPDSELLAAAIPDARLEIIQGAAHGLMIEHAWPFNRIVLDFLSSVPDKPFSGPRPPLPGP